MGYGNGRRVTKKVNLARMTISSRACPPTSRSGRVVSPSEPLLRVRTQSRARVRVLRNDLAELSRGHRDVHGPADPDDLVRENAIALRCPVRLAEAIEGRHAEVVGNGAGDATVPGALDRWLLQLLIDRRDERAPEERADHFHENSLRRRFLSRGRARLRERYSLSTERTLRGRVRRNVERPQRAKRNVERRVATGAVDEDRRSDHDGAGRAHRVDGLLDRAAGRHDVVDHKDVLSARKLEPAAEHTTRS